MSFLDHRYIRFIARRMLQSAWLILLLIALNFTLIHFAPGDPAYLLAGQSGDEQYFAFIRTKFGLDQPLPIQLWHYLLNIARGDFGFSLAYQQPVLKLVLSRVPATLLLMTTALMISSIGGVLLGVETARRQNTLFDRAVTAFAAVSDAIPSFCLGQAALIVFALWFNLFPAQGMVSAGQELTGLAWGPAWVFDVVSHLALPAMTLAIVQMALIVRLRFVFHKSDWAAQPHLLADHRAADPGGNVDDQTARFHSCRPRTRFKPRQNPSARDLPASLAIAHH